MPIYSVIITRDITESTVVEVEAETTEQAEDAALDMFFSDIVLEWKKDDCLSNPYVTGIDPLEPVPPTTNLDDLASST